VWRVASSFVKVRTPPTPRAFQPIASSNPASATPASLPADAHHPSNQVSPLSDQSPHPTPVLADFGMEKKASLEGMDEKAVEKEVTSLLK